MAKKKKSSTLPASSKAKKANSGSFPKGQTQKEDKKKEADSRLTLKTAVMGVIVASCLGYLLSGRKDGDAYRSVEMPVNRSIEIERRSNLSLQEFIDLYDTKWPVLITDVMKDWPAMKKWGWDFFLKLYGGELVAMKGVHGKLRDGQSYSVPLRIFHEHVHESTPTSWTYINDELFIPARPQLTNDIKDPIYMKENFFKLLPKELQPWDNMLLWGTKHSRSSLHIDPYNWTGTNAVFKGVKRWKLYPPGQDHLLYVMRNKRCGFPLDCYKYNSEVDAFDPDLERYPLIAQAKAIEFEQMPGEMLIIPSGWFHQAYNPEQCLAVSSQFFNSQSAKPVLEEILKAGEIKASKLSGSLSPEEQVKALVKEIPKSIIQKGKKVTKMIAKQFERKT